LPSHAAATHPGLQRKFNEDRYAAEDGLGLYLVADGMGGYASGEVAAEIVRDTLLGEVSRGTDLADAIHRSHELVLEEIARRDVDARMGTTVVALLLEGGDYTIAWIGDSRAYLWDGSELRQLTRDHSYVHALVERGSLASEEARSHPDRHALTQSIGVSREMELRPGIEHGSLQPGERILLRSDGLTEDLSDTELARQLGRHDSVQDQAEALVNAALRAGGRDNVTVLVVSDS
jgi:protein phosphatase